MFRKANLLACLVLGASMVGSVPADTIFHWTFDGTPDANIVVDTDIVSGRDANKFDDDDLDPGADNVITYGPANPWYNTDETSADFNNTPGDNDPGVGLRVADEGPNSLVDLSTLSECTIEAFVYMYEPRQQVIVRKNNSPSNGGIYYIDTRGSGNFGVRLAGHGEDIGDANVSNDLTYDIDTWYHVALVWDGSDVRFYLNGQQSHDLGPNHLSALPFVGPIDDSTTAVGIGCIIRDNTWPPGSSGQFFHGRIDEVRISDKALSVNQFLYAGFADLASNPSPSNQAPNVCPTGLELTWTPGENAASVDGHNIYFGTSPNDVNAAADPCVIGHDTNSWTPDVELGETYYWRIDEVNDGNTWPGPPWYFTVEDGKVRDRSPSDGFRGLAPNDVFLSWTPSCLAASHDVFIGTDFDEVNDATSGSHPNVDYDNVTEPNYDPGDLDPFTSYYWRVDEVGSSVKGDVWSFRTGLGGVLLYYKFDGSQGASLPNPITDDSGNNIQFQQHIDGGSLTYGPANTLYNPTGTSASFDPNAGLYRPDLNPNTPDNPDILRLDGYQYTIEMWVKVETPPDGGDAMLIGKGPWRIILNDIRWGDDPWDNEVRWFHNNDAEGEEDVVEENEWMHIAAVFDQTLADDGDSQRLYINGDEVSDGGHPNPNPPDSNAPAGIGAEAIPDGNFAMFLDGQIDELRILDVALSPVEFLYPRAIDPDPFDGEGGIDPNDPNDPNVVLSWVPWAYSDYHDVYFGTDYISVRDATTTVDPNGVYIDRVDTNSFIISDVRDLEYARPYYWRIDEVEGAQPYLGVVWEFTTKYEITDPNLLLWYPFDETEGDWVFDHSGHGLHGYDGSVSGGWDEDGRFDGCLEFDDNIGFNLPTRTLSNVEKEITVAVWLDGYRDDYQNTVLHAGANGYYIEIIVPEPEDDFVYWQAGNDTNDLLVWNDATPQDWIGDWHHFAFVKDEDAGTMTIYFDADVVKSKPGTISSLSNIANQPFRFGSRIGNTADYVGRMDDLRVYDYALSKAQIAGLFRGGDVEYAWAPKPYDGQPDAPYDTDLIWRPGDYADLHDVYFGTDWDEVNDANTTIHPNVEYTQLDVNTHDLDILDLDQWYYWRVDEINDSNNDFWRGSVWRFRVAEYITIDDMEAYNDGFSGYPITSFEDPYGWDCGYNPENGTSSILQLSCATCQFGQLYHGGYNTMRYDYYNNDEAANGYYSEISNHFTMDPCDWTTAGVKMLTLWFRGTADSNAHEQMYVGLEDNTGFTSYSQVNYGDGDNEDMNDIKIEEWQQWNIPLNSFTADLQHVEKLYIGFGERYAWQPGGFGTVYFDDIRLYQPTCVASKLKPDDDLNFDCIVDFGDVRVMAGEWLKSDANLGEVTKPSDTNLVGWWEFDEGTGSIAYDSSGYDNNGVIATIGSNAEWVPGRNDVNYALDFDGGYVTVADDGNTPELRPRLKVSVAAWIILAYSVDDEVKVAVKGRDDHETYAMEINEDSGLRFLVRDANDRENQRTVDSEDEVPTDSWVHVAATYDGNDLTVYVNGQAEGTIAGSVWEKLFADTNDGFAIGGRWGDSSGRFPGTIDDVRVYDRPLTAAEIGYIASDGTGLVLMQSIANLVNPEQPGERVVNLKDFAALADSWLEQKLWPE